MERPASDHGQIRSYGSTRSKTSS
ncbi:uncharacterized protein G2W53_032989 [Senna tora]|uniref:Uncharacterized protein n=1 Tax=Senna tora TaxID=362788 RepID=A0A834W847_9FABA|nr:uncharacterized protein G2W53_032989 [Senna tora]